MQIKAEEISDNAIHFAHCICLSKEADELKSLLSYDSDSMIRLNKSRALATIDVMQESINELRLYIESK